MQATFGARVQLRSNAFPSDVHNFGKNLKGVHPALTMESDKLNFL